MRERGREGRGGRRGGRGERKEKGERRGGGEDAVSAAAEREKATPSRIQRLTDRTKAQTKGCYWPAASSGPEAQRSRDRLLKTFRG